MPNTETRNSVESEDNEIDRERIKVSLVDCIIPRYNIRDKDVQTKIGV